MTSLLPPRFMVFRHPGLAHWGAALLLALAPPLGAAETLLESKFATGAAEGWHPYREPRPATVQVRDGALEVASSTAFRGVFAGLPKRLTLKPGETLKVALRFRLPAYDPSVSAAFRIGFFTHAPGEPEEAGADHGFFLTIGGGPEGPTLALREDRPAPRFDPLSGNTRKLGQARAAASLENGEWHSASLSITAVDDTALALEAVLDGQPLKVSHPTLEPTVFGSLYIGSGNCNARMGLNDIVVTLQTP